MTELKHSCSVLIEQTCFDSIEVKKQKQLSYIFTHYTFAENYLFHLNTPVSVKGDFAVYAILTEKNNPKTLVRY